MILTDENMMENKFTFLESGQHYGERNIGGFMVLHDLEPIAYTCNYVKSKQIQQL